MRFAYYKELHVHPVPKTNWTHVFHRFYVSILKNITGEDSWNYINYSVYGLAKAWVTTNFIIDAKNVPNWWRFNIC